MAAPRLPESLQQTLERKIRAQLSTCDLETVSRKALRNTLQQDSVEDLTPYKREINALILHSIDALQSDNTRSQSDESGHKEEENHKKTVKSGRGAAFQVPVCLSPELANVLHMTTASRPQVVKKMWAYIRQHALQNPSDKRTILLDEAMQDVFGRRSFTMFSMNKYLSRHLRKPEVLEAVGGWEQVERNGESSEEDEEKKAEKERKKRAAKRKRGKTTTRAPNPNSAFHVQWILSEKLAALVGEPTMSRPQVVKRTWAHIKDKALQNPDNKREILCDATLENLLGHAKVTMFSLNKYLSPHFLEKVDKPTTEGSTTTQEDVGKPTQDTTTTQEDVEEH